MNENYAREIAGKRWVSPEQYAIKKQKQREDFKLRLAGLTVAEATKTCLSLLAITELDEPTKTICREYLASNT